MKLNMSLRELRDLGLDIAGKDEKQKVQSVIFEHVMDKDSSLVRRVRQAVSEKMLATAAVIDPQ